MYIHNHIHTPINSYTIHIHMSMYKCSNVLNTNVHSHSHSHNHNPYTHTPIHSHTVAHTHTVITYLLIFCYVCCHSFSRTRMIQTCLAVCSGTVLLSMPPVLFCIPFHYFPFSNRLLFLSHFFSFLPFL